MIIIKRNSETKKFEVEKENASAYDAAMLRMKTIARTSNDAYYISTLDETMSIKDILKETEDADTFQKNFKSIWAH